jgi:ribosomal 30S subunit maturation factor RimM
MIVRDGSKEYLIPMVDAIVVSHDEKQVVIDPPPGLLEINTSNSNR